MLRNLVSNRNLSLICFGLLLALVATTVSLKPKAARADEGVPFRGTLTVQYIGSQSCALGDTNCTACVGSPSFSVYIEAQGIANTSLGPLFAEVLKCFDVPGGPQMFGSYAGTLTTTAPNKKDSLTWAYIGQNDNGGDFYGFSPFSGTLTITGGTGKFANAHGRATFTAASSPSFTATIFPGPASPFSLAGTAFYVIQGTISSPEE